MSKHYDIKRNGKYSHTDLKREETMETNEMLELTSETENTEQTVEEIVSETVEVEEEIGIEFTDTEATEEVEQIKEEEPKVELLPKTDVNKIVEARLARERRKFNQEKAKYEEIVSTLKAGMGKDNLDDISSDMKNFYKEQGIDIPDYRYSNERDEQILAKADATEIIDAGTEEMERVANEIARIPLEKRTVREKTIFNDLAQKLMLNKSAKELAKIGVKADILEDKTFKTFAEKFSVNIPITEIYEMYKKVNKPQEAPKKPIGSVKNTTDSNVIKDYYSPEEVSKFTENDLRDPKLMEVVENSMSKWK